MSTCTKTIETIAQFNVISNNLGKQTTKNGVIFLQCIFNIIDINDLRIWNQFNEYKIPKNINSYN